LRAAARCY